MSHRNVYQMICGKENLIIFVWSTPRDLTWNWYEETPHVVHTTLKFPVSRLSKSESGSVELNCRYQTLHYWCSFTPCILFLATSNISPSHKGNTNNSRKYFDAELLPTFSRHIKQTNRCCTWQCHRLNKGTRVLDVKPGSVHWDNAACNPNWNLHRRTLKKLAFYPATRNRSWSRIEWGEGTFIHNPR